MEDGALIGSWKEGILAIGTFGFDHPSLWKDFEHKYLCQELCDDDYGGAEQQEEEEEEEEEEEIEFPLLVLKACKHGFFGDQGQYYCDEIPKPNDHEDSDQEDTDTSYNQVKVEAKKLAGERITLADLFWADSENNMLNNKKLISTEKDQIKAHYDDKTESNTKHDSYDDNIALISMKKLKKHHATRPIKKINRMVRKMLKKKIHPDVENQKEYTARLKPMRIPAAAGSLN